MLTPLSLQAMYFWSGQQDASAPLHIDGLDPKQSRRLSALAKLALNARQHLPHLELLQQVDHILWCSSYGDEHKTLHILEDIARQETPSPTAFATAVHNATAGLYAMLYQDGVASTSLNIGVSEFVEGLLYAHALLDSHNATQVLLIATDEPLPSPYQHHQLEQTYALACVLAQPSPQHAANLSIMPSTSLAPTSNRPEAVQFAEFWQQTGNQLNLALWQLCKH